MHPDAPGPAATTSPATQPDLDLKPEQVTSLAGSADTAAQEIRDNQTFRNLTLDASMFGGVEKASAVVRLHETAHRVMVDTLDGVEQDLLHFGTSLREAVRGHEQADELSSAALQRLSQVAPAGYSDAAKAEATNTHVTDETLAIVPEEEPPGSGSPAGED